MRQASWTRGGVVGALLLALVSAWAVAAIRLQAATPTAAAYDIVRDVTYVTHAAGGQTADLYLPPADRPSPAVLLIHGGAWMAGNKNHSSWHARRLAEQGFAVIAINYRLAPEHPFPAQLEDCRAALRWIAQQAPRYGWDVERLAAYGYSAGGHLACLLGMVRAEPSPKLRAVVAGGAPVDFSDEPLDSRRLVYWLGATRADRPAIYREASPTAFVTEQSPPVFFYHGEHDRVVPVELPRRLRTLLTERGVRSELHVVEGAGHLAAYLDASAFQQSVQFLRHHLRAPADSLAVEPTDDVRAKE
jgi:triacylglycerol lipase